MSRWLCCFAWVLIAFAVGASGAFDPDPEQDGASRFDGLEWREEGEGYSLWLRDVGDQERLALIRDATGVATDPFASPPGAERGFLSFYVQIYNTSKANLVFEPQKCWVVTNRQEIQRPLGVVGLEADFGIVGRPLPEAYRHIERIALEHSRLVPAGQKLEGLLVYRALRPRTKRFRLDVALLTGDGEVVTLQAAYRRRAKEKEKKHKKK